MALKFFVGNTLETLAERLAGMLRERPAGAGAFAREVVAVMNPGNAKWLTHELARQTGVCANVDFVTRGGLWNHVIPGMREASGKYDPKVMAWRVLKMLSDKHRPRDDALAAYLQSAGEGVTRAHYGLANEIASTFDVYHVYRYQVLDAWSNGKPSSCGADTLPHASWQRMLWERLRAETDTDSPAELYMSFLRGDLDDEARKLIAEEFPLGRVFVFGIGTLAPLHLHLYQNLATFLDVNFLYLNPSRDFWGDVTTERNARWRRLRGDKEAVASGNQMLAALASSGKTLFNNLLDIEAYGAAEERWQSADSATVLGEVQNAVLENVAPDLTGREADDSLVIHICHSEIREMEVLRDDILRRLDPKLSGGETISPHDIVVMAPNISKYAPAIEAVFGQWNKDHLEGQRLLYSITDRTHTEESQLANAFKGLVAQGRSRMKFGEFRELLSYKAIWGALGIDESQIEVVLEMLYNSGIRWGWDAKQREEAAGVAFGEYSWEQGLRKLALEYVAGNSNIVNNLGDGIGRALGAVADLAQRVNELRQKLRVSHTPQEWRGMLTGIANDFLFVDEDSERDSATLRAAIAEFGETCEEAGIGDLEFPCEVVEAYMEGALWSVADTGRFLSRGITFCRLQPLRNIPAKYVWIAGVNDNEYPRRDKLRSFDLLKTKPEPGDRSNRDDDCQLLLEAMLAARHYLRFSYVGNDAHDNKTIPPGVLLNAVRSQLVEAFKEEGAEADPEVVSGKKTAPFELRHHLHHFSPDYFDENGDGGWQKEATRKLWMNLSAADYKSAGSLIRVTAVENTEDDSDGRGLIEGLVPGSTAECDFLKRTEFDVDELLGFWGSPANKWLAGVLKIYGDGWTHEFSDDEPVDLDALSAWDIRSKLLDMFFNIRCNEKEVDAWLSSGDVKREVLEHTKRKAILPIGVRGEILVEQSVVSIENSNLIKTVARTLDGWEKADNNARVSLDFDGRTLRGEIGDLYLKDGSVMWFRVNPSKAKLRDWMQLAVVNALLPISDLANGEYSPCESVLVTQDSAFKAVALKPDEARPLAELYFSGMLSAIGGDPEPLMILANNGALECAMALLESADEDNAFDKIRAKWSPYYSNGDSDLSSNTMMFGRDFPERFKARMLSACNKYMLGAGVEVLK